MWEVGMLALGLAGFIGYCREFGRVAAEARRQEGARQIARVVGLW